MDKCTEKIPCGCDETKFCGCDDKVDLLCTYFNGDRLNTLGIVKGMTGEAVIRAIDTYLREFEYNYQDPDGNGLGESNLSYSLDERLTGGTWLNGEPIYKRTFTEKNVGATTITIPNAIQIINLEGMITDSENPFITAGGLGMVSISHVEGVAPNNILLTRIIGSGVFQNQIGIFNIIMRERLDGSGNSGLGFLENSMGLLNSTLEYSKSSTELDKKKEEPFPSELLNYTITAYYIK